MAKLIAEVAVSVESNLDGASGALVDEAGRLGDLYEDLQGLRGQMDEGVGTTRRATINTMFFEGGLAGVYQEAVRTSGAFAAIIDTISGYIGTVLDSLILEHADSLGGLVEGVVPWLDSVSSFLDTQEGTTVTGVDGVDYIFDPILGWKESPFLKPGAETTFTMRPAGSLAEHILDLGAAIEGIERMGDFQDDADMKRLKDAIVELKELEKLLVKDPAKTMANFWMGKFRDTQFWKDIAGGG